MKLTYCAYQGLVADRGDFAAPPAAPTLCDNGQCLGALLTFLFDVLFDWEVVPPLVGQRPG